jgi:hypothetical protein
MRPKLITPESSDEIRLNRISEMQQDLAFLLSVNWLDVDDRIKARVLAHAAAELRTDDETTGA